MQYFVNQNSQDDSITTNNEVKFIENDEYYEIAMINHLILLCYEITHLKCMLYLSRLWNKSEGHSVNFKVKNLPKESPFTLNQSLINNYSHQANTEIAQLGRIWLHKRSCMCVCLFIKN